MNDHQVTQDVVFHLLKHITNLPLRSLKHYPFSTGIYKNIPIQWVDVEINCDAPLIIDFQISNRNTKDFQITIVLDNDKLVKQLEKYKYFRIIHLTKKECPHRFKNEVTNDAINELIDQFRNNGIKIPVLE